MLLLILLAVVLCSLAGWLVRSLGVEAIQVLIALALMTITWRLARRRANATLADEFRNW